MNGSGAAGPPQEFEEYRILRTLGGGAMGQVYLARDTLLDRLVAVKFIATSVGSEPDASARARFFQEARAIARLQHPNVVAIYRVGEVRRQPYLVSEFIRGESLDKLIKPLEGREVLRIAIGLARGLAAVHRCGVLHRDIKPANAVRSEEGEVKLVDFGLAELLEGPSESSLLSSSRRETAGPRGVDPLKSGERSATDAEVDLRETRPLRAAPSQGVALSEAEPTATRRLPASAEAGAPLALEESGPTATRRLQGVAPEEASSGESAVKATRQLHGVAPAGAPPEDSALRDTHPPAEARSPSGASAEARTRQIPAEEMGISGTPLYMAPEMWRGEPASRASDIYAIGVLLYELCAGKAPHDGVPIAELPSTVQQRRPRPLAEVVPELPAGLAAVVDRCLMADPAARYDSGDSLREALEALDLPANTASLPVGNPYRGLMAFDAGHRGVFFGREAEQREVLDRLRADPFVLLAGDSGVGKSSLCRAAVLPAVAEAGLGTGEPSWLVVRLTPGRQPLEALAEALAPALGESAETLLARAAEEPGAFARALRQRLPGSPGVLLFMDQLEELVTFSEPAQASRMASELAFILRRAPHTRVLATVRSDCLTRLVALPGLGDEVPRALYLVRALSERGLRRAVVEPAKALGVRFESEALVDTLVAEATRTEGGLPLLQFALAELWEARDKERQLIPAAALEAMGGVAGALARHADGVVARLRPEQRPRARELLLQLVTPEGTRARRTGSELLSSPDDVTGRAVLEGLVQGRLLLASEAEGGEGRYELVHESLLTSWDALRGWLGHDEERRAVRLRLERAAAEWDRLGRPAELLYGDRQLSEAAEVGQGPLGPRESEFFLRSRRASQRRRARRWALALGLPLLVLSGVGVVRLQARLQLEARVASRLAEAQVQWEAARAQAEQAERLRQEAFTLFDTPGQREKAEEVWVRAREAVRETEAGYLHVMEALESAWALDPNRTEARERLGDVLLERIALAGRTHRKEQREELMARLAVYDASGERRQRLMEPARLSLSVRPEEARVRLADASGAEAGARVLGTGSLREVNQPAGSHVLLLDAPGWAPVRAPVLLQAGEELALELALPPAASVPEGFVYVPAGRYLRGSADDDQVRQHFFRAAPLHTAWTEAFLVARHEVTFADWMAFLRELPAAERAERMPGASTRRNQIQLEPLPGDRWRLTLRPTTMTYVALDGEPLRYGRRDRRAEQDWRRFPVAGISFGDAEAYAAWLDRTGRIPGARLCTEDEWERAARGADGRPLPSGNRLGPDDANYDLTYGREPLGFGPDEVGSHPASRSPWGLDDMAGNVWEWVRSRDDVNGPVIRGGSWYQDCDVTCQSVNWEPGERTQRDPLIGLRLCATPRH
jgi:serine/threonine protein kinase/formylglycine-generating enzyme required for sulfatase activity